MTIDLAGYENGTPERFVPGLMRGELVEAEHLSRYWWAAGLARGRRVLDAGCGLAYGSAAMAAAGATSVVGVDLAQPVLDAAAAAAPANVELIAADVTELPFEDDSFDLVVCFEVIEHVEQRDRVLDELVRVARPGALVLVSSPNRDVYVAGNPHHVHEYRPDELRDALASRLSNVALLRQYDATTSVLLPEEQLAATGRDALTGATLGTLVAWERDREPYTVAVASDAPLPPFAPFACLTQAIEVRTWVDHFASQQRLLDEQARVAREFDANVEQRRALERELERAEQQSARLADVEERLLELEADYGDAVGEREKIERQLEHQLERAGTARQLEHQLERAGTALDNIKGSVSWRMTRPLRDVRALVRGR